MQIVAVIPSRYGSTRFAGKPLALICGKPMIRYVYESAKRSGIIDHVVVATDDPRIQAAVEQFGGQALLTSQSLRSGTDRSAEAATLLNLRDDDIVINIQGDQPLVDPRCFEQVVAPLKAKPDLGISTLAIQIADLREYCNPKDCKVVLDAGGFALYFSRAPIPFGRDTGQSFESYKHLGVYAYRKRFLDVFSRLPSGRLEEIEKLEQLRALEHGYPIYVAITPFDSPEVDVPEDIARIEKMFTPVC
jgi:3-deoxy-manno-octulosonate cytidylyltransferase (CMP-KDO synthetase)